MQMRSPEPPLKQQFPKDYYRYFYNGGKCKSHNINNCQDCGDKFVTLCFREREIKWGEWKEQEIND